MEPCVCQIAGMEPSSAVSTPQQRPGLTRIESDRRVGADPLQPPVQLLDMIRLHRHGARTPDQFPELIDEREVHLGRGLGEFGVTVQ